MLLLRLSHCLNLLLNSDTFKLNNLITSNCRRSLTADTQNALLLLSFNFTNEVKLTKIHVMVYLSRKVIFILSTQAPNGACMP
jgi:hypothetical protein